MKKCLIWGSGIEFSKNIHLIQYYEAVGLMKVVGITSNDVYYKTIINYKFVEKREIMQGLDFDYLILAVGGYLLNSAKQEAIEMGINEEKIVPIKVMALPGFDFVKYSKIKGNIPTIIAPNCWGGITYKSLELQFNSPFINMFEDHDEYIHFLRNIKENIELPLEFVGMRYENRLRREYPLIKCGEMFIHFNHYENYEEAVSCWERRKKRINWDNIIYMFYDTDKEKIKNFLELTHEYKVCFSPLTYEHKDVVSLNYERGCSDIPFWQIVNGFATGRNIYYDVFELLLNHKVVPMATVKQELI